MGDQLLCDRCAMDLELSSQLDHASAGSVAVNDATNFIGAKLTSSVRRSRGSRARSKALDLSQLPEVFYLRSIFSIRGDKAHHVGAGR